MLVLAVGALMQIVWAFCILLISVRPPTFLADHITPHYDPGIVYSIYSGVHAFYTIIGVIFCGFLHSKGWLRAASFASMVPGPGILFGLIQVVPATLIFRRLGHADWDGFFRWMSKKDRADQV